MTLFRKPFSRISSIGAAMRSPDRAVAVISAIG